MEKTSDLFVANLEMFGIKLGLEQIRDLLNRVENPQNSLRFIHIAGTNGKGSTCALVEKGLRHCGFRTGLYTSPHLISIHERFRINGKAISEEDYDRLTKQLQPAINAMIKEGCKPTFFEFTTALAALWFAQEKCDFVLWETGMGGRLDATNIVDPILVAFSRIGMDHQQYLGHSLAKIAAEKAGILKPGKIAISAKQLPEVKTVLQHFANQKNSPLYFAEDWEINTPQNLILNDKQISLWGSVIDFNLLGYWQLENAALAYRILETLAESYSFHLKEAIRSWKEVSWPGRFQIIEPDLIIDGAHNPDGAQMLANSITRLYPEQKATFLFANFADKETFKILTFLAPKAEKFIFCPIVGAKNRPSLPPDQLSTLLHSINASIVTESVSDSQAGFELLKKHKGLKIVAGSLYLAGEILSNFYHGKLPDLS